MYRTGKFFPVLLGDISVAGEVVLTVNSDLNGPLPQFTLTCISTGGPATTVTWTRDSTTVTGGTETLLANPVTAQYNHTLFVSGRLPGLYICNVRNNKPSTVSEIFTVRGWFLHNPCINLLIIVLSSCLSPY